MPFRAFFTACTALLFALAAPAARAADAEPAAIPIGHVVPGLPGVAVRMQSMRDLRFAHIVRQQQDFTCGAAALATILQQMFGRATSEQDIIDDMLAHTDPALARSRGFSMLDMKDYLERAGLRGRGYRIGADALQTIRIPVIALQTTRGYAHFVVVKRVHAGIVHIADPVLGHRQLPLDEFVAAWNGIVFAVLGDGRRQENALRASAVSRSAGRRADLVTRRLPPQQEFGLFAIDTF